MRHFLTSLILLCLCLNQAFADRLYVRNKPFQGYLLGTAQDIDGLEIEIGDLARALGFKLEEIQGNWVVQNTSDSAVPKLQPGAHKLWVGGKEFPYRLDSTRKLVKLGPFAEHIGAKLQHNRELGIIDLNLVSGTVEKPAEQGIDLRTHRLVYFGAEWAPASKLFLPVVEEFERKMVIPVTLVDCTQPRSPNYRNNIRYFNGNQIPYTVLISPAGKVVKTWTGYHDLGPFTTEILKLIGR